MTTTDQDNELIRRRAALCEALAAIGDFRPGTLQARYRRCGKPSCHCARAHDPGHGPKWVLTRTVDGRRRNWSIPDAAVAETRMQVDEYRRFRALTRELMEVSERLCQERLLTAQRDAGREAKKGASRQPSRRRSGTRSSG